MAANGEAARLLAPAINDALMDTTAKALSGQQVGDHRAWFVREAEVAAESALVAIREALQEASLRGETLREALGLTMETCNCARPEHTSRVVGDWR